MRSGLAFAMGAALSFAVLAASADEPVTGDSLPWHLARITKADRARVDADAADPGASPLKYLHLELNFKPTVRERKMHTFRVVNQRGKTVGELYGHHEGRSQLVFESEEAWTSLIGLYLDGLGHREPLFGARPVVPEVLQPELVRPVAPRVERPAPVHVTRDAPRTGYVPPTEVRVPRTTTVVPGDTTHVIEAPGSTRIIRSPIHVIRVPDPRHVVRVPDTTRVVREGTRVVRDGTTHVVRDGGARVIREGGADVVTGGVTDMVTGVGGGGVAADGADGGAGVGVGGGGGSGGGGGAGGGAG
ncbi:MAG: hypothetical protein ABIP48_29920, partial [Planctomycetota bacterium]